MTTIKRQWRINKVMALLLVTLLMLPNIRVWAGDSFSIYLVRHAEKQKKGDNPSLTACGAVRAKQLAALLSQTNIAAIYSTSYQRTMQTAQPLARLTKLPIKNYNPKSLEQLAFQLKRHKKNTLIVGHSNTTPILTALLSSQPVGALSEDDYQMLYQVQFSQKTPVITIFKQPLQCTKHSGK